MEFCFWFFQRAYACQIGLRTLDVFFVRMIILVAVAKEIAVVYPGLKRHFMQKLR